MEAVWYTYTPKHVAAFARMLRDLKKELHIAGFGVRRIGIYVIWWQDWSNHAE